jgi:hypothetical protein
VRARDNKAALDALAAAGHAADLLPDGMLQLGGASAIAAPDDVAGVLVRAGARPTEIRVEEEELEQYFLRLVASKGGPA